MTMVTLYDDTYTGTRYRYGAVNRPPCTTGAAPDGWIVFSHKSSPDFRHGVIDYPFRLPDLKAEAFELVFVGEIAGK